MADQDIERVVDHYACIRPRPRPGDLEAAARPHAFRPYDVNPERCDLCGLPRRVRWIHPDAMRGTDE